MGSITPSPNIQASSDLPASSQPIPPRPPIHFHYSRRLRVPSNSEPSSTLPNSQASTIDPLAPSSLSNPVPHYNLRHRATIHAPNRFGFLTTGAIISEPSSYK